MGTITIGGRKFEVTEEGGNYVLTGVRGARYRTMRNVNHPHMLFLVNLRGWTKGTPATWLTDKNGKLEVAR